MTTLSDERLQAEVDRIWEHLLRQNGTDYALVTKGELVSILRSSASTVERETLEKAAKLHDVLAEQCDKDAAAYPRGSGDTYSGSVRAAKIHRDSAALIRSLIPSPTDGKEKADVTG